MPQAPRDVPEVDPDTQGQENPISTSTDESIGITFCVWTVIPRVATPIRDTPRDDLSIRKSNVQFEEANRDDIFTKVRLGPC